MQQQRDERAIGGAHGHDAQFRIDRSLQAPHLLGGGRAQPAARWHHGLAVLFDGAAVEGQPSFDATAHTDLHRL